MKTTTMKELYKEERPYEKCLANGAGALSDTELLAVILRSGTSGETVCQLAGRILSLPGYEGLSGLRRIPAERLLELKGVGHVKAVQLKCLAELAAWFLGCGAQALVLGCTHFPYFKGALAARTDLALIDPAEEMVARLTAAT